MSQQANRDHVIEAEIIDPKIEEQKFKDSVDPEQKKEGLFGMLAGALDECAGIAEEFGMTKNSDRIKKLSRSAKKAQVTGEKMGQLSEKMSQIKSRVENSSLPRVAKKISEVAKSSGVIGSRPYK